MCERGEGGIAAQQQILAASDKNSSHRHPFQPLISLLCSHPYTIHFPAFQDPLPAFQDQFPAFQHDPPGKRIFKGCEWILKSAVWILKVWEWISKGRKVNSESRGWISKRWGLDVRCTAFKNQF